jgi:hypothetical protein
MVNQEMLDALRDGNIKLALEIYVQGVNKLKGLSLIEKSLLLNNLAKSLIGIIASAFANEKNWLICYKKEIMDEIERICSIRKNLCVSETEDLNNDLLSCRNILRIQPNNQIKLLRGAVTAVIVAGSVLLAWYLYPRLSQSLLTSAASLMDDEDGASIVSGAVKQVAGNITNIGHSALREVGRFAKESLESEMGKDVFSATVKYVSDKTSSSSNTSSSLIQSNTDTIASATEKNFTSDRTQVREEEIIKLRDRYPLNTELEKLLDVSNSDDVKTVTKVSSGTTLLSKKHEKVIALNIPANVPDATNFLDKYASLISSAEQLAEQCLESFTLLKQTNEFIGSKQHHYKFLNNNLLKGACNNIKSDSDMTQFCNGFINHLLSIIEDCNKDNIKFGLEQREIEQCLVDVRKNLDNLKKNQSYYQDILKSVKITKKVKNMLTEYRLNQAVLSEEGESDSLKNKIQSMVVSEDPLIAVLLAVPAKYKDDTDSDTDQSEWCNNVLTSMNANFVNDYKRVDEILKKVHCNLEKLIHDVTRTFKEEPLLLLTIAKSVNIELFSKVWQTTRTTNIAANQKSKFINSNNTTVAGNHSKEKYSSVQLLVSVMFKLAQKIEKIACCNYELFSSNQRSKQTLLQSTQLIDKIAKAQTRQNANIALLNNEHKTYYKSFLALALMQEDSVVEKQIDLLQAYQMNTFKVMQIFDELYSTRMSLIKLHQAISLQLDNQKNIMNNNENMQTILVSLKEQEVELRKLILSLLHKFDLKVPAQKEAVQCVYQKPADKVKHQHIEYTDDLLHKALSFYASDYKTTSGNISVSPVISINIAAINQQLLKLEAKASLVPFKIVTNQADDQWLLLYVYGQATPIGSTSLIYFTTLKDNLILECLNNLQKQGRFNKVKEVVLPFEAPLGHWVIEAARYLLSNEQLNESELLPTGNSAANILKGKAIALTLDQLLRAPIFVNTV